MIKLYNLSGIVRFTGLKSYIPVVANSLYDAIAMASTYADCVVEESEPSELELV